MSTITIEQALQIAAAHHQAGQLPQAEVLYRHILAVQPQNPDALRLLGLVAQQVGRYAAAVELISQAIAYDKENAVFHIDLGVAYDALGQSDKAMAAYHQAITLKPDYAEAYNNLGNVQSDQGRLMDAIASYERALTLNPGLAEAHNNLGTILASQGQWAKAIASYQRALAAQSAFAEAHNNLGNAFQEQGRLDDALTHFDRALTLRPDYAAAHNNRGNVLKNQGRLDEAIACYRRAVSLAPDRPSFGSNLVYALHFHPDFNVESLSREHRQWAQKHEPTLQGFQRPHFNRPDPTRRLKIGYISPDLREHPVGRFLLPLLENHDHLDFEILCYADVLRPDSITERLRNCVDHWRETTGASDERMAEWIREDGIDILVDLSLHMAGNRLPVFARKPAPVQATYLAYCSTSGLGAMDCRLSDRYLDPPEANDNYSEMSIRLPETYWCYRAPDEAPEIAPLPAASVEHITFGCFNNFSKINERVLRVWARLLRAAPNSRLVLFAHEGGHRERTREVLAQESIDRSHLDFVEKASLAKYFGHYGQIDIALDTFPYAGGTTTCDALWMGVPVVSLAGQTAVSRGGLSILSNIGLPELAAQTEDEYVRIAVDLAHDLPRLAHLRATMRQRMQTSPLMDAPRFARNIENAYRTMWQKWCNGRAYPLSIT